MGDGGSTDHDQTFFGHFMDVLYSGGPWLSPSQIID